MASVTSTLSLFFILLATYCYSLPLVVPLDAELTTVTMVVDHDTKVNMLLVPDDEVTGIPDIRKTRSLPDNGLNRMAPIQLKKVSPPSGMYGESESSELTTSRVGELTHPPHMHGESESSELTTSRVEEVTRPPRMHSESESSELRRSRVGELTRPPRMYGESESSELTTSRVGELTHPPYMHDESESSELTTSSQFGQVSRSHRTIDESSSTSTPMESAEFDLSEDKRAFNNHSFMPFETSNEFETRAISGEQALAKKETPTFPKRLLMENATFTSEPSVTVASFRNATASDDSEELTTSSSTNVSHLTSLEIILPGDVNVVTFNSSIPYQLSQGQKQPIIKQS